jgi:hypothetical protein
MAQDFENLNFPLNSCLKVLSSHLAPTDDFNSDQMAGQGMFRNCPWMVSKDG